jgi:hypothetical protein
MSADGSEHIRDREDGQFQNERSKFGLEQPGNSPVLSSANRVAPKTPVVLAL